jgi:hypothetical protein
MHFHSTSPINVCTRAHYCIVLLWQEAIACGNKVLLNGIVLYCYIDVHMCSTSQLSRIPPGSVCPTSYSGTDITCPAQLFRVTRVLSRVTRVLFRVTRVLFRVTRVLFRVMLVLFCMSWPFWTGIRAWPRCV